jgi:preprotein translocase subunit YajC
MKKLILITIATLALTVAEKQTFAQVPEWVWAESAGGTDYDGGSSVATDAAGNVYVTGYFYNPSITFDSTVLTNANGGSPDIFITKYDSNGTVIWAKSAGGTNYDVAYSISTDTGGNVYVTGYFSSPSITFGSTVLTNGGLFGDIFITKYDSNGTVLWAKGAGGTSSDYASGVSTDAEGNVYVTGYFWSSSITFGSTVLTNAGLTDIIMTKYDSNGTVLWAKSAGGTEEDRATSVSTDAVGNVYVTGFFESPSITFGSTVLTNTGAWDIFITKYDSNGNVLWAEGAGGTDIDRGYGVSVDAVGNVYLTGFFSSSSITFDSTDLTNASGGNADIFITKYHSNGTVLWGKGAGGTDDDDAWSVSTDAGDNVYVTGDFSSSSITFGSTVLTNLNEGSHDIFITKYDSNGNVVWAKSAGGTSGDYAYSVSTDATGNVYVTGEFGSPFITFDSTTLTGAGVVYDIFIAKISATVATGFEENNFIDEITVFPNPFSTQAILQTGNLLHNATLTLDNVFGQTVKQIKNISGQTIVLSRDNLVSGLYFLRLTEDNKTIATKKLVITD